MERVLVIGSPGAGKSTLAAQIARLTGLPLVHMDRLAWKAGWVEVSRAELESRVREAIAGRRWVIDGNYGGTLPLRVTRADTVIDLDLPRWLCVWSLLRRVLQHRGETRDDMAPDCPERLDWEFLVYTARFGGRGRRRIERALAGFKGQRITLRSRSEVRAFLAGLSRKATDIRSATAAPSGRE
ncbi:MAG TPA: AAA family ATPase [Allosphingosinicella sp.]|nr:AAA family ATPase [Allosphingosinicella sp.]